MKTCILLYVLISITFLPLLSAQTGQLASPSGLSSPNLPPARDADITSFHVDTEGVLHVIYSDKSNVEVPKEKGRFTDGEHALTQETFSDIQVADDNQHIGWLADYMICQQSYPCAAELVIFQSGHELVHISPPVSIMWKWWFHNGGKQIVAQFGFPHGDEVGAYALFDTNTGRKLAEFLPAEETPPPKWLQQLPHQTGDFRQKTKK